MADPSRGDEMKHGKWKRFGDLEISRDASNEGELMGITIRRRDNKSLGKRTFLNEAGAKELARMIGDKEVLRALTIVCDSFAKAVSKALESPDARGRAGR
jgi:hypothetical protein